MKIPEKTLKIYFIWASEGRLHLEGTYDAHAISSLQLCIKDGIVANLRNDLDKFPDERKPFYFEIPVTEKFQESVFFTNDKGDLCPISFGKFSPIQKRYKNSYYWSHKIGVKYKANKLCIAYMESEKTYERNLIKEMIARKNARGIKDLMIRIGKRIFGRYKKPIWIISDRVDRGGDNGEALFRYAVERKEIKVYFAILKDSEDFNRLKKIGKVIPFGGWQYKLLYLMGAVMISSQGEDVIFRPFKANTAAIANLVQETKFVFLQHGITKDDVSDWLNRFNKNISMFICATRPEYKSILTYAYDYKEEKVQLTGFPRHDLLDEQSEKIITIMPTWRHNLVELPGKDGTRKLKDAFEESAYYMALKELLTNEKLQACLKEVGYRMRFVLHPCMEQAWSSFDKLSVDCEILKKADYREIFNTSKLIVTDYSSVVFDFALMRKPVIYCQPDKAQFFDGSHMYKQGYFDYERDGFGDVVYTVDDCVDKICELLKNGCEVPIKYKQRIDETFPYASEGNCKRVYEAIKQLK